MPAGASFVVSESETVANGAAAGRAWTAIPAASIERKSVCACILRKWCRLNETTL
jgi:hypothetical protein